jgi:hypothetical protein
MVLNGCARSLIEARCTNLRKFGHYKKIFVLVNNSIEYVSIIHIKQNCKFAVGRNIYTCYLLLSVSDKSISYSQG